jgi:diaminopimelate epimerase
MTFTKMTGTGNDFILIDNSRGAPLCPPKNRAHTGVRPYKIHARRLCHRQNGVGADGILFLEKARPGTKADFRMRIFNPDGSEAEMCGNGIRCIADYAYNQRIAPRRMNIETMAGVLSAEIKKRGWVRVMLSPPKGWKLPIRFQKKGIILDGGFVNTGVPHAVFFVDDLERTDVEELGEWIRRHHDFSPRGTNVNFVHCASRRKITVRTYERGVEGETLACGTGVMAAALVAAQQGKVISPVEISTRGGEVLWVDFVREKNTITKVWLEGAVKTVFRGEIENV